MSTPWKSSSQFQGWNHQQATGLDFPNMSIDFGFTSAAFRTCLARKVHVELADSKLPCCSTTQPWLVLISNAALTSLQWYINVYHKSYIVLLNYCMTVKKRREVGAHLRQILYCINRNQIESPPGIVFNHSSPGWKHVYVTMCSFYEECHGQILWKQTGSKTKFILEVLHTVQSFRKKSHRPRL